MCYIILYFSFLNLHKPPHLPKMGLIQAYKITTFYRDYRPLNHIFSTLFSQKIKRCALAISGASFVNFSARLIPAKVEITTHRITPIAHLP